MHLLFKIILNNRVTYILTCLEEGYWFYELLNQKPIEKSLISAAFPRALHIPCPIAGDGISQESQLLKKA